MNKFIMTKDVWEQLRELLHIPDMRISGGVTIRLNINDVVRVDIEGIMPTQADVTTLTDEIETHAPVT